MDKIPGLHNRPVSQDLSIAVSEKEVKLEIKKNRIIRLLYVIGGTVSLVLAILGIVVPGLPVTPLALLSAFLYAKSSPKLYHWLLNNKILGPKIKNYQRRKGITRRGKAGVLAFMSIMVLFSSFLVIGPGTLRWVIISLGIVGCIVVVFFVPNAKQE
ncbi:YbaN family protein [Proteiniphilum sp. X52]|uniref:YbaN family protein n=1 Tax=Proteiniphilum sp. X52 TaxID=2382159 RepID=UPI002100E6EF|nr:YbaN family protein [Proteiniphilum sp. X52]